MRPQFDGDVARENAPAVFEVVRVTSAGEKAPLAQAQMRLYREERQYYWRFDDQRGWNSGYTETEELQDSRAIALNDRAQLTVNVGAATAWKFPIRKPAKPCATASTRAGTRRTPMPWATARTACR